MQRIEEQRIRDRYQAQQETIAHMTRQFVLMQAQCAEEPLIELANKNPRSDLEQGCLDAYFSARSYFFLAKTRISPSSEVKENNWDNSWNELNSALEKSGSTKYNAKSVSEYWQKIINSSDSFGR